jgi:predicted restriction endonuclease
MDLNQQDRQIRALGNVSRADRELWTSFISNSEAVAEQAEVAYDNLTSKMDSERAVFPKRPDGPTETEGVVKIRRVQSFFRTSVLISYDITCALTGIVIPDLLNASHIVPWSVDPARRADPRNGICLNVFHDRAFDRGLITFDEKFRTVLSPRIADFKMVALQQELLLKLEGQRLRLPCRFRPDSSALEFHRDKVFQQ